MRGSRRNCLICFVYSSSIRCCAITGEVTASESRATRRVAAKRRDIGDPRGNGWEQALERFCAHCGYTEVRATSAPRSLSAVSSDRPKPVDQTEDQPDIAP